MNEHGRDSIQSVFMGKESAKQLLLNVEELMSKWSLGQHLGRGILFPDIKEIQGTKLPCHLKVIIVWVL